MLKIFNLLQFSKIVSVLHGFHNLFTGIFHQDSGRALIFRLFIFGVYVNKVLIVVMFVGIPSY
jgi:hypothetical protein